MDGRGMGPVWEGTDAVRVSPQAMWRGTRGPSIQIDVQCGGFFPGRTMRADSHGDRRRDA